MNRSRGHQYFILAQPAIQLIFSVRSTWVGWIDTHSEARVPSLIDASDRVFVSFGIFRTFSAIAVTTDVLVEWSESVSQFESPCSV